MGADPHRPGMWIEGDERRARAVARPSPCSIPLLRWSSARPPVAAPRMSTAPSRWRRPPAVRRPGETWTPSGEAGCSGRGPDASRRTVSRSPGSSRRRTASPSTRRSTRSRRPSGTSSTTPAGRTRWTAVSCACRPAPSSTWSTSHSASWLTSSPGTTRWTSSRGASPRRSRWATPSSSSRRRRRHCPRSSSRACPTRSASRRVS